VEYMLFVDEAPLRDPIKGVSTFTTTFPQRGPRDKQGRSLRDFDLNKRLFRYPLSYMIYTQMLMRCPQLLAIACTSDWSRCCLVETRIPSSRISLQRMARSYWKFSTKPNQACGSRQQISERLG
jgi:hypothetical protein